ncbi:MAG: SGNH/GDSL hydrolase family protein [Clostridia bacterium]|nr:SGNH/GDSL hydrolase family protein [Clostridia bacterium]
MAERVVFLGDSITMGYGLDHVEDRFSTVFCKATGAEEFNYGITGTLMARAGLSKTDGTAFIDRFAAMEEADLVVMFGATNDYFWSDTPIVPENSEDDRYFLNAVRHLCQGLKEKYPKSPIVFITPYQMRGIGNYLGGKDALASNRHNTDQCNFVGSTLADYVQVLRQICAEYHFFVLDLFRDLGADIAHSDTDEAHFTLDGCHPNTAGHKRIADMLASLCKEHRLIGEKV